jgi:hypothetical protein
MIDWGWRWSSCPPFSYMPLPWPSAAPPHRDLPRLNTREGHTKGVGAGGGPDPTAPRTMKQRMHDPLAPEVRSALELHYKEEVEVYRVAKRVHEAQVMWCLYIPPSYAQRYIAFHALPDAVGTVHYCYAVQTTCSIRNRMSTLAAPQ